MLGKLIRNHLLTLLVCVLGVVEVSYAQQTVGVISIPGTLQNSRYISSPGSSGSLRGGSGIGNLYSAPQGSGVLSTSINRAPQHNVLRQNRSAHRSNAMRSEISRSSTPTHRKTGNVRNAPVRTDISKIPRATPKKSGSTQIQNRASSAAGTILGGDGVLKIRERKAGAHPALLGNFAGATYVAAIEHKSATPKNQGEDTVTTLVPENPGVYQDKMLAAEIAFRNQEFRDAVLLYGMSLDLSSGSPESLLGMMHTHFAASTDTYALAALYLKNTLECFPELPLVNIDLKAFYADPIQYRRDLSRLEKYVENNPENADAQLVLGYFLWRNGEINDSKKALNMAVEYSGQKELDEAIDTLWSGMVASGKVSGKLQGKNVPKPQEDKKATASPETDKS